MRGADQVKAAEEDDGDGGSEGGDGERGGGVEGALPADAADSDSEDGEISGGNGHRRQRRGRCTGRGGDASWELGQWGCRALDLGMTSARHSATAANMEV